MKVMVSLGNRCEDRVYVPGITTGPGVDVTATVISLTVVGSRLSEKEITAPPVRGRAVNATLNDNTSKPVEKLVEYGAAIATPARLWAPVMEIVATAPHTKRGAEIPG